jgi:hypothetical protein
MRNIRYLLVTPLIQNSHKNKSYLLECPRLNEPAVEKHSSHGFSLSSQEHVKANK